MKTTPELKALLREQDRETLRILLKHKSEGPLEEAEHERAIAYLVRRLEERA
jgi:hypothetical protein